MSKICRQCDSKFEPRKRFQHFCDACSPLADCERCGKTFSRNAGNHAARVCPSCTNKLAEMDSAWCSEGRHDVDKFLWIRHYYACKHCHPLSEDFEYGWVVRKDPQGTTAIGYREHLGFGRRRLTRIIQVRGVEPEELNVFVQRLDEEQVDDPLEVARRLRKRFEHRSDVSLKLLSVYLVRILTT